MIETIAGWRCDIKKGGLLLTPPEGPGSATIRFSEGLRPLKRAHDIVRELPVPPGYRLKERSAIERLTTAKGEHAGGDIYNLDNQHQTGEHGKRVHRQQRALAAIQARE